MKTPSICLTLALLGLVHGFAQDEFDPLGERAEEDLPKLIRVQVEFIEVPQATMTALLHGPKKSSNDTELRAKLQVLLDKEEAKMLETQLVTTRPGTPARSESFHEFIYPTEYDPPVTPSEEEEVDLSITFPMNPAIPTAFETRNVGSSLEVDPTIDATDKMIDLQITPELTYYTGNEIWTEVTKEENTYRIQMPNFYTIRVKTQVTTIAGQPLLVGAVSPKDDEGTADFSRKVLVFVRAEMLTVGR